MVNIVVNSRAVVILLLLLTLLGVSATDIYITSMPQMMHDFNTSPAIINSTMFLYNLGISISVLFIGVLSNRFGRKSVLITSIIIFSTASLLIALVPNIWFILCLRALQGTGLGSIIILQRLILHDIMNEQEQIHASGLLVLGSIISPAIAPIIGTFLASIWSWHACFWLSSLIGLILACVSSIVIPETNTTPIKQLPNFGKLLQEYLVLLRDPVCLNLVIILCLTFAVLFAFLGISSYLYILTFGLSPLSYSYIFILIACSFFVGNSYMMYLNKIGTCSNQIIKQGVLCGVLGVIILSISLIVNDNWLIICAVTLGIMIMRFASALTISPLQIKIVNHFNERSAPALGIAVCLQFGFAGAVTSAVGLFTESMRLYGFVTISGSCLVLAALSFFILERKLRRI